ncbi:MAG: hypothetical protein Q8L64_03995 [bacterium]|nr:hypothetical protein [bacterium]
MYPENSNATTNAILVILLVIIVGLAVWFIVDRRQPAPEPGGASLEINLDGNVLPKDNE